MIRTLLTTTALAALLGTAVIAQDAAPAAPEETQAPAEGEGGAMAPAEGAGEPAPAEGAEAPAEGAEAPAEGGEAAPAEGGDVTPPAGEITEDIDAEVDASQDAAAEEPFDISQGYTAADSDNLVTELLGMPVYSSAADDAEEIGNVDNLVFSEDGQIEAVIIGVGGFLGIGEKLVAADFQALQFVIAADNTERWVLETTAEALEAAPEFVWEDDAPDAGAPAVPADPNAPAMPADPNAPAAPAAPAPAEPAPAPEAPAEQPADPAAEQPAEGAEQPAEQPAQ